MNEQEIINKVKKYLEKRFKTVDEKLISYSGIRKNAPMFNTKEKKDLHIINYTTEANEGNQYTSNIYTITLDAKTGMFEYILGKNILEKIDE